MRPNRPSAVLPKWLVVVFATAAAVPTGCQPASDRLEVSGAVSLDGAPLNEGSIRFASVGDAMIAGGALIRDGQYVIPQENGLPPGTYRLEITSPDNDAPPIMYRSSPNDRGFQTQPDRIPPEYNVESQHTVEVKPGEENHFEFHIASRVN